MSRFGPLEDAVLSQSSENLIVPGEDKGLHIRPLWRVVLDLLKVLQRQA
jgi:hypothetical protein